MWALRSAVWSGPSGYAAKRVVSLGSTTRRIPVLMKVRAPSGVLKVDLPVSSPTSKAIVIHAGFDARRTSRGVWG